jgi:hypothetical protein
MSCVLMDPEFQSAANGVWRAIAHRESVCPCPCPERPRTHQWLLTPAALMQLSSKP